MSTYNGWKNKETWLINLHFNNDPGMYETAQIVTLEMLHESARDADLEVDEMDAQQTWDWVREDAEIRLADYIREQMVLDACEYDIDGNILANDLLTTALAHVDYREIADSWIDSFYSPHGAIEVVKYDDLDFDHSEDFEGQWLVRWTWPGYIDSGSWRPGETPREALENYFMEQ